MQTTKLIPQGRAWAVFLSLSLAAACGSGSEPAADTADRTPVLVDTGRSSVTSMTTVFEAGGVLAARQTAIVSSRVMAPITRVVVGPGERVQSGQVLVELESDEVTAQAERSRASLAGAQAGARVAASGRAAAEASVTLARATHARVSQLHAERSATAQELDEATAALKVAEARMALTTAQAEASERTIEAAEAASRSADIARSWSVLVAPFDGIVAARHADPGTMAVPGQPLLTLERLGALQLDVHVDASRAAHLAVGQSADVRVDASTTSEWTRGRISEIARVEPASHSFLVTVDLDPAATWRSGLFGRARFTGNTVDRLTVPVDAIVVRGQLTFVYVVGLDNHVRLRLVSLGQSAGDRTEVLAGLSDGDRVVVGPAATLTDGALVRFSGSQASAGVQR